MGEKVVWAWGEVVWAWGMGDGSSLLWAAACAAACAAVSSCETTSFSTISSSWLVCERLSAVRIKSCCDILGEGLGLGGVWAVIST